MARTDNNCDRAEEQREIDTICIICKLPETLRITQLSDKKEFSLHGGIISGLHVLNLLADAVDIFK